MISFKGTFSEYFARPFPYAHEIGEIIICPFWTVLWDGAVLQNSVHDTNKVNRITQLIQESLGYSFVPTGVFTATWDGVPYYRNDSIVSPWHTITKW